MQSQPLFHLAFPVHDPVEALRFYGGLPGCPEGRGPDAWVDFDFRGHQIVARELEAAGTRYIIGPRVRLKGRAGEPATMFFSGPSGNAPESKAFGDRKQIFAK